MADLLPDTDDATNVRPDRRSTAGTPRWAKVSGIIALVLIRSDAPAAPHSTATFPVPGAVVVPIVHVHIALPSASVVFGPRPAGRATLPSGMV